MEIIGLTFGFFLKKRIEDSDRFLYDLEKEIGKKLTKVFSMPPFTKDEKLKLFDDFPLLDASHNDFDLNIATTKVLIDFKGKGKKDIQKFLLNKKRLIEKIFNFIQKNNKIRRIGIILKFFTTPKNEMEYLEKFINKDKFPDVSFRDIAIKINLKGKINNIPINNIFNILKATKENKGKKTKGLKIYLDINNLNNRNLKKNEVKPFFEELKKEIVNISKEKIK